MAFASIIFPHDGNPNHSKALDGLRGLAVLIVIVSHLSNNHILLSPYLNFSTIGKYGVYLFFVLSSYLLDKQIIHALRSEKANFKYWLNYSLRRFLRIIPLFIVALTINLILTYNQVEWAIQLSFQEFINHVFFQQGKDIFWSIPVEFKYYIISPLLMIIAHKVFKWQLLTIIISTTTLIVFSIAIQYTFHFNELSLIKYLPLFLFGSLLAILEETQPNLLSKIYSHRKLLDVLALASLLIIFISTPYYFNVIFNTSIKHFHHYFLFSVYAMLWSIVLMAVRFGNTVTKKLFEIKLLRIFGSLSFSLYLFHIPILNFINTLETNASIKFFAIIISSLLFSLFTFLLIEKPLSKIRLLK